MKTNIKITRVVMAIVAATLSTGVYAKGGTAKPPGTPAPFVTSTLPDPTFAAATPATTIHQFDDTGMIQNATVSGANCPGLSPEFFGGTVTINGITITVPCNMIVQMPANTITFAKMVNGIGGSSPLLSLALDGSTTPSTQIFTSFELGVVGNIVGGNNLGIGGEHIAGLMYASQQSLNGGNGVIKRIDYTTGDIIVDSGTGRSEVIVRMNDPHGRFGRAQSPDERFSVDDENPTIHSATGYPMCVPRNKNSSGTLYPVDASGIPNDPLCPQKNRPRPPCRNFSQAFSGQTVPLSLPASGELSPAATGQTYCSQFVMRAPVGTVSNSLFTAVPRPTTVYNIAQPTDADARVQAPFEVGDFISYSGTLMHPESTVPLLPRDYISAHTIEANVGIYTQPYTKPSYVAIGEFGIGTADPNPLAVSLVAQETQDRIFLEAETTDVKVPVDIYMVSVNNPTTGAITPESNRWTTPFEMTGECQIATTSGCYGNTGGITTQNTGPQPQRARIRATKAPAGLLSQPSRNIRIVARSLCAPTALAAAQPAVDACLQTATDFANTPTNAALTANGLVAGQYLAPVGEYIFPEGVKPGDPTVPNDFWHLPFLVFGDDLVGPLTPNPWGGQ